MVAILAIGNAFFAALSFFITRIGLRGSNPLSGLLMVQMWSTIVSFLISRFYVPLNQFANTGVLYFIAVGVLASFVGRFSLYVGMERVGASIATPLSQTKPLFSAIAAILILSETLTPYIALGTFLIIIGAVAISAEESGGQIEREWSRKDLLFPIMSAACFGASHVLRKMGLNIVPEPIVGVTVQNATSVALVPLLALIQRKQQRVILNDKRAWFVFCLAGLSMVTAQMCLFHALDLGRVVIVTPLSALSPFFVLLLVAVFLRKLERVTWKIVLGSVLIVGGTVVLTLVSRG